jgi:antitoxin MazE
MAKFIEVSIRRIGNSQGIVIPKAILEQIGLTKSAEMAIEGDTLILRKPQKSVRAGWADEAQKIAFSNEDRLVLGEFINDDDEKLTW